MNQVRAHALERGQRRDGAADDDQAADQFGSGYCGDDAPSAKFLFQAPPSVVTGMIGYAPSRAEAIAAQAGGTWKRYAAGEHGRLPPGELQSRTMNQGNWRQA